MFPKRAYILVTFLVGGVIGIFASYSTLDFLHGVIFYISPTAELFYINAFLSYGILVTLAFLFLKSRWNLILKFFSILLLFGLFFVLNYYASIAYFEGTSEKASLLLKQKLTPQ